MARDTMPVDGMRQLQLNHAQSREVVEMHLASLRGGCGSLDGYADACKIEVSLRLIIEKLIPVNVGAVADGHDHWRQGALVETGVAYESAGGMFYRTPTLPADDDRSPHEDPSTNMYDVRL